MATRDQHEWIRRVLGVDPATVAAAGASAPDIDPSPASPTGSGPATYGEALNGRLDAENDRVAALAAQGVDAGPLQARLDAIAALIADDPESADDHFAEIDRLLLKAEVDQADAAIPRDARAPLLLRKLVTEWRAAQDIATANLDAIGKAFLADREVQADPRFGDVADVVKELDTLLPSFGTELTERVAAVIEEGHGPGAAAAGLKAVRACRSQLDGASVLLAIEAAASEQYGGGFAIVAPLADVLDRMEGQLEELVAV